MELTELVPSCALQARIRSAARNVEIVAQLIYLPPDARGETVAAYQRALERHGGDGPFYAAGDFNLQLLRPRDSEEAALADRLHECWRQRGVAVAPQPGPTRRSPHRAARRRQQGPEESTIDGLVAPAAEAWAWTTKPTWRPRLSDHASLRLDRTGEATTARKMACTSWAFARLPQEAVHDLRRRFYTLEAAFGVVRTRFQPMDLTTNLPQRDSLGPTDPAATVLDEAPEAAAADLTEGAGSYNPRAAEERTHLRRRQPCCGCTVSVSYEACFATGGDSGLAGGTCRVGPDRSSGASPTQAVWPRRSSRTGCRHEEARSNSLPRIRQQPGSESGNRNTSTTP